MLHCWKSHVVAQLSGAKCDTVKVSSQVNGTTVLPAKSDSDAIFLLQLLSRTLTCTLHLS